MVSIKNFSTAAIRATMALKGYTLQILADKTGKSPQFISSLINKKAAYGSRAVEQQLLEILMPELEQIHKINGN